VQQGNVLFTGVVLNEEIATSRTLQEAENGTEELIEHCKTKSAAGSYDV
jgi:hypothetical protein